MVLFLSAPARGPKNLDDAGSPPLGIGVWLTLEKHATPPYVKLHIHRLLCHLIGRMISGLIDQAQCIRCVLVITIGCTTNHHRVYTCCMSADRSDWQSIVQTLLIRQSLTHHAYTLPQHCQALENGCGVYPDELDGSIWIWISAMDPGSMANILWNLIEIRCEHLEIFCGQNLCNVQ